MFERWGEQYSELTNILDYNKNIHRSRSIVNKKSQVMFMFQGLQLPEAFNNLDYNKIIYRSRSIVNKKTEKKSSYAQCAWTLIVRGLKQS